MLYKVNLSSANIKMLKLIIWQIL